MAVILLADDDTLIRSTMQKILTKVGHTVIEASTGVEAEAAFDRNRVDLLITDIVMPDKEGLALVRDLKKRAPGLRIIAMSGGGRSGAFTLLEVASQFGADAVMKKPFRVRDLIEMVDAIVKADGAPLPVQGS